MSLEGLSGASFVGFDRTRTGDHPFRALAAATGEALAPEYSSARSGDLDAACKLAREAAPVLASLSPSAKAGFLRKIASNIESLGETLLERVAAETGLSSRRVAAETFRTCSQLRFFAGIVEEGSWVDARIDLADPDRKPAPKPDVRSMHRAIGPVAVFGASNFPLAFSVAGGDTASAFAAGNPVIVKAHPAHPGTSELVANAIVRAVKDSGLPEGTFSMLFDSGFAIATALVARPEIKAVGFTGSRGGGCALMKAAAARPDPIPFYAEMSSINPVIFLDGSFAGDWEARAGGLFASATSDSGQFCTKPGLVFVPQSHASAMADRLTRLFTSATGFTMLAANIRDAYRGGVSRRGVNGRVQTLRHVPSLNHGAPQVNSALFRTTAADFLADPSLAEEIFGPAVLLIEYAGVGELLRVLRSLEGQLTATIHGSTGDLEANRELLLVLEKKAGRLIFNGYPTGVEVCQAMIHGGPWPATSDGRTTSVGGRAILRFARPVCYQNFPQQALPPELKDANPSGILRIVDGSATRAGIGELASTAAGEKKAIRE